MYTDNRQPIEEVVSLSLSTECAVEASIDVVTPSPPITDHRSALVTYVLIALLVAVACAIGVAVFGSSVLVPVMI